MSNAIDRIVPAGKRLIVRRRGRPLIEFTAGQRARHTLGPDDAVVETDAPTPPSRTPEQIEDYRARLELQSSDTAMVRVLEDLVDVLVAKDVIRLTDLPADARQRLLRRKAARGKLIGALKQQA